jgi:hypothetical protein
MISQTIVILAVLLTDYYLKALGIALAHKRGIEVRSCILCSRYNKRFGRKKCGLTDKNISSLTPSDFEQLCQFKVDEYEVRRIINKFNNIPYYEWLNK